MLYLVIETVPKCWSSFLLRISQMMALIRSLIIPTIWGNFARCMFKFDSGYFFPCSSEIFLKIRTKASTHPSGNILLEPIHRNGIYIDMTTTTISSRLTTHLASGSPTQHNPRWLPTASYTISSTIQKCYFLTNHNKLSITEASYKIFSHPLTTVKLFTQLPTKPSPSYSYNYLPFPTVTTYPTNCPHHFSFLSALYPNK